MKHGMLAALCILLAMPVLAHHGVVLLYHHVDDNTPVSTSISPAQFKDQLDYIEENGFVVVPLLELLKGVFEGRESAAEAVAITFDDAYESVYHTAFPELSARGMPFTVFVATQAVERGHEATMSWQQLRELKASGLASFGAHSQTHGHLLRGSENGITDAWIERVSVEIDESIADLTRELGLDRVQTFAYPYGEYSQGLEELVAARGLYGLAQLSGGVGEGTPVTAIPRFPMSRTQGSLERLAMALDTRPLPVTRLDGAPALINGSGQAPKAFSFSLSAAPAYHRDRLGCFSASGESLTLAREGDRFTVRLPAFQPGRNKVNCTAPSAERAGEFFWYSQQWVLADAAGSWLAR
mgnify:FL=1|tara:strand:+ start:773 stop:1834 length:1062 start_codon:yes stop_codon:yes gene_type:complete